jgi:hypothetical protein
MRSSAARNDDRFVSGSAQFSLTGTLSLAKTQIDGAAIDAAALHKRLRTVPRPEEAMSKTFTRSRSFCPTHYALAGIHFGRDTWFLSFEISCRR